MPRGKASGGGMQTGPRGGHYHVTASGSKSYTPVAQGTWHNVGGVSRAAWEVNSLLEKHGSLDKIPGYKGEVKKGQGSVTPRAPVHAGDNRAGQNIGERQPVGKSPKVQKTGLEAPPKKVAAGHEHNNEHEVAIAQQRTNLAARNAVTEAHIKTLGHAPDEATVQHLSGLLLSGKGGSSKVVQHLEDLKAKSSKAAKVEIPLHEDNRWGYSAAARAVSAVATPEHKSTAQKLVEAHERGENPHVAHYKYTAEGYRKMAKEARDMGRHENAKAFEEVAKQNEDLARSAAKGYSVPVQSKG